MSFISYLKDGISLGSIYAIIALGYTMVYGIAKMLNFAHGDVIMVGAYIILTCITRGGMSPILAVILSVVICTLLGVVIEKVAYSPLRKASSNLAVLITAIGVSYLLQNLALLIFGADAKSFVAVIKVPSITLFDGELTIKGITIVTILACIIIMVGLSLFVKKTKPGRAMQAVSEDRDAAQLMGVNVNATISLTFAIGSGLAAIAGLLLCQTYPTLTPYTGAMPGIKAFVAAVFGGIGSIPGAMVGGILLGIIEIFGKAYISSQVADAIVFAVLIVVLLVKPTGLFGNNMINYGIVIVLFVIVQALSSTGNLSRLLMGLLVPLCVYTIASVSLNLVVGFSGELSLGHAGFMCVGAFSSALFSQVAADSIPQVPRFILAILVGAAVAALFGVIIGIPVLRLRGDYLAIVTLAFGEIIKNLINVLYIGVDDKGLHVATSAAGLHLEAGGKQILKGALGISGTATLYKDIKNYFFLIGVILLLLTLFIVQNLVNSRSGRAIMSTRDNRIAAESVGINITRYKLLAFTISAALAGVAGVLYAHNLSLLKVSVFDYNMSILVLVYVVLGGIGNIRGSIIATIILYALPELLRGFANYRMLIYAIVLIIMMLFNWAPAARDWRARMVEKFKGKKAKKEVA